MRKTNSHQPDRFTYLFAGESSAWAAKNLEERDARTCETGKPESTTCLAAQQSKLNAQLGRAITANFYGILLYLINSLKMHHPDSPGRLS